MENNKRLTIDWILPILEALSAICWIILVPLHFAFVGQANAFLEAPAILWFMFGIIFLVFCLKTSLNNLSASTLVKNSVDTVD